MSKEEWSVVTVSGEPRTPEECERIIASQHEELVALERRVHEVTQHYRDWRLQLARLEEQIAAFTVSGEREEGSGECVERGEE